MQRLRHALPWLVASWLVCHVAVLVAVPAALSSGGFFGAGLVECDCPDGEPGEFCPMHASPNRTTDPDGCAMRSACAPTDAAFVSLGIGLGILPAPVSAVVHDRVAAVVPIPVSSLTRADLPDSPPPRA